MTGNKIIKIAREYLGWNGKKFCYDYGLPFGSHWCCAFVWDIFRIAKASRLFYGGQKTAYVPTAQEWLKANCEHVRMTNAKAGDIVVFTWLPVGFNTETGSRDHIGFIRKAGTSKVCYTIEGNTGTGDPKTSTVKERTREAKYIFGIYRPNYKAKKTVLSDDKGKTNNQTTGNNKTKEQTKNKAEHAKKIDAIYKVISPVGMNIRKAPDKASKRLGGVGYGKKVKASKIKGDWIYAKYGNLKGWIKLKDSKNTYMRKI